MAAHHSRITVRDQLTGVLFAGPHLVGLVVFLALPLAMALWYSFTDYPLVDPAGPVFIGTANYTRLASDAHFHRVLLNTLTYSVCSVPFSLFCSLVLALLLNEAVPFRALYRTIVFLPSLLPGVAAAMIWLWVLNPQQGLLNLVLEKPLAAVGAAPPNWLGSPALALPTLIALSFWGVGNTVVIFLAGLQDVPTELYEAAELDGATRWQRLRHVTLPILSPVIFFNLVMGIIGSWQFFELPYILTGGGPNRATESISMYLFTTAMRYVDMGYASAMAFVQFVIIVSVTFVVVRTSRRWVHYQ